MFKGKPLMIILKERMSLSDIFYKQEKFHIVETASIG